MNKEFQFDFERLQVYQKSLILIDQVFTILPLIHREHRRSIGDSLVRAAISVSSNLAEGNDQSSSAGKARFYDYASNSARECAFVFIILYRRKWLGEELFFALKLQVREITSMIKVLKQSL